MRILVIATGGLDSMVLARHHLAAGHMVVGMLVRFGPFNQKALDGVKGLYEEEGIPYEELHLEELHQWLCEGEQGATPIPNRNMILLGIALSKARIGEFDAVSIAVNREDGQNGTPDQHPSFMGVMQATATICVGKSIKLLAPFQTFGKADIIRTGAHLGVPLERSWSCREVGEKHCGRCAGCKLRQAAFKAAGVADKTEYVEGGPKAPPAGGQQNEAIVQKPPQPATRAPSTLRPSPAPSPSGDDIPWTPFIFDDGQPGGVYGLIGNRDDWLRIVSQSGSPIDVLLSANQVQAGHPPRFSMGAGAYGITLRDWFEQRGLLPEITGEVRI